MAAKDAIGIGLVGVGRAGWGMHRAELKGRESKFRIVAACDPVKARRDMIAEDLDCAVFRDMETMLKSPGVEVVDIASPSPLHVPQALTALKAGKVVFLEKPIALSLTEALALKRAVKKDPNRLFVRHNRRFEPTFQHIREIMETGVLGDVYEIKLRRQSYQRRNDWQTLQDKGGGQLLNWGPHIVDHALCFLDGRVDAVWSDLRKIAAVGDAEDHVHIILKGMDGARVVDLEISGGAALSEPTYLVLGSRGALRSDEKMITMRYLDPKHKLPPRRAKRGLPAVAGGFGGGDSLKWIEKEIKVQPKTRCTCDSIWDHLYAAVRKGVPYPISLDEALQVMDILSRARRGTASHRLRIPSRQT